MSAYAAKIANWKFIFNCGYQHFVSLVGFTFADICTIFHEEF
jgi:hypothetical protein